MFGTLAGAAVALGVYAVANFLSPTPSPNLLTSLAMDDNVVGLHEVMDDVIERMGEPFDNGAKKGFAYHTGPNGCKKAARLYANLLSEIAGVSDEPTRGWVYRQAAALCADADRKTPAIIFSTTVPTKE